MTLVLSRLDNRNPRKPEMLEKVSSNARHWVQDNFSQKKTVEICEEYSKMAQTKTTAKLILSRN